MTAAPAAVQPLDLKVSAFLTRYLRIVDCSGGGAMAGEIENVSQAFRPSGPSREQLFARSGPALVALSCIKEMFDRSAGWQITPQWI